MDPETVVIGTEPTIEAPQTTVLDTSNSTSGAGEPSPSDLVEKPESLRDTLKAEMKADTDAREEEPEEKPKEEAKEEKKEEKGRTPDGKFAKKEEPKEAVEEEKAPEAEKPSEEKAKVEPEDKGGKPKLDAPQNFLPNAKEKWHNTPHEVRSEVHRVIQEAQASIEEHKQTTARYEELRQFDEGARRNGLDLRESLERVAQLEDLLQANPLAGMAAVLRDAGPRKPDGNPLSLYEFAEAIVRMGPDGYNRAVQVQQQPQQQQPNDEVAALKAEVERMKAVQQFNPIIERFRAENPRYDDLEEDIAFFLKSGKIPLSLSASDRLSAAYDMAVRINPSASGEPENFGESPKADTRAGDFGGKSIKSAPGAVTPEAETVAGLSIKDALRAELKRTRAN